MSLEPSNPASVGAAATDAVPSTEHATRAGGIPSVDWWITSRCNLACDFCYGPVPGRDPVELRDQILETLAVSSASVVTFCGGEPLLVRKISAYASALRNGSKATVLNTNGTLLRRHLEQGLKLAFTMVGISIEGSTQEVHRAMRGPGADLDEALAAARVIAAAPGISLKVGTVVSSVNRHDLPSLARLMRDLRPDIWRLYQYSSRGKQNSGQRRHKLPEAEFQEIVDYASALTSPVPAARSSESETQGCLIVDPKGNVLQPSGNGYINYGNCVDEPLDVIWSRMPARSTIIANKRWLSILD
jgi:MoaA/NifB/PqqE/SkfB family radical SAM enzyme